MRYATQKEMDDRIERIVKAKVKHYYTDWKNYDRVKYMGCKGSVNPKDKFIILMVRECGTYMYTLEELESYEFARTVYEYFMSQEISDYYEIDLNKMEVKKHKPNMRWLKEVAA